MLSFFVLFGFFSSKFFFGLFAFIESQDVLAARSHDMRLQRVLQKMLVKKGNKTEISLREDGE